MYQVNDWHVLVRNVDQRIFSKMGNFTFPCLYSNTSKVWPFGDHLDLLLAIHTSITLHTSVFEDDEDL